MNSKFSGFSLLTHLSIETLLTINQPTNPLPGILLLSDISFGIKLS